MKNKINITGSITFEGWTSLIGFFVIFLSLYFIYLPNKNTILWLIFLLVLLFGLMLFISLKGVLIDLENKRIKVYTHCLFFKLGKWKPLDTVERIVLEYLYGSNKNRYMHIPFAKGTKTETFTVSIRFISGEKIFIKGFSNYEKAKAFLDKCFEGLEIEKKDCYKIMLDEIEKRRRI